jgi:hypothetical protein
MANLIYTADILADALFRAGEPTDGTSDYAGQSLSYLNNLYMQICRGGAEVDPGLAEDWAWLRKPLPGVLVLSPPMTAGTVAVTQGSAAATLSQVPVNYVGIPVSAVNWFLKITSEPDIVRVIAHTPGTTALTLDAAFTGDTAATAGYTLFLTDYDLAADLLRVIAPLRTFRNSGWNSRDDYKIYSVDLDTMEEEWPLALIESGIPDYFAPIGETTGGVKRVRFNRCGGPDPTVAYRVEYEYLYRPTPLTSPGTLEEPALPREWRHLLADYLTAYLFGIKHDDRMAGAGGAAQAGLRGMASENRYKTVTATHTQFRLKPRASGRGHRRRVLRTESGMIIG